MQAVSSYRVNSVYWLLRVNSVYWLYWFNLVIFERRYPLDLLLISLTGFSVRRSLSLRLLSGLLTLGLLWAYSLSSLSGLTLWFTLCRILWPISSRSLSLPSLPSGLPPLQIRHKAYAVTLVTSLSVYRGAHSNY